MVRILITISFLFFTPFLYSQQNEKDSLWSVWSDPEQVDSVRLMAINTVIRKNYLFNRPDTAFELAQLQYEFAEAKGDKKWMSASRNTQGVTAHIQGDYFNAIKYYNMGMKIAESIGNTKAVGNALNNIGIIYKEQEEYEKALDYFNKSFKLKKSIGDKSGVGNVLGNIGGIYASQNKDELAIDYFNRGLIIQEEIGNKRAMAGFLNNIGSIFSHQKEFSKAQDYFNRSLVLRKEINDLPGVASCLANLGELSSAQGNDQLAISYYSQSLEMAREGGIISQILASSAGLYASFKRIGNYKKALEMLEVNLDAQDSLNNDKNKQEIIRQEFKYQYDKQHLADSLQFAKEKELKDIQHRAKLREEKNQKYILYGGLFILILIALLAYRSYILKKKSNEALSGKNAIITRQKEIVELKNREILDSINYAKRIQSAILPPDKLVKEYLEQSFILYKPKDIVAGDFYWLEHTEDKVLFAAADCTGHGVPGAMVSVVCNNGLNRAVREHGLTDPGQILDKTREIVVQEFEKSEEDVKDGMDIALCCLKTQTINNKQQTTIEFSGANNPLWIIRPCHPEQSRGDFMDDTQNKELDDYLSLTTDNYQLLEIKADKQPIGKHHTPKLYTTHTVELQPGDSVYIFSDGYADQFGGENGKKMKTANFKKLLLSIQEETMDKQRQFLDEAFESWKGELEQLDDVCILGVKIA